MTEGWGTLALGLLPVSLLPPESRIPKAVSSLRHAADPLGIARPIQGIMGDPYAHA